PETGREWGYDIVQMEISTRDQPPRSPGRISDDWLDPRPALIRHQRSEVSEHKTSSELVRNSSVQATTELAKLADMAANQIESAAATRAPHRFRYLIDIVILVAVVFGIEGVAIAVYTPKNMQSGLVFDAAIQMLQVLI